MLRCHLHFKNKFNNFIHVQERAKVKASDTEQTQVTAAHNEAFNSVIKYIEKHIIKQQIHASNLSANGVY